ncbi:hypothetical protein KP509_1Z202700 [Ceratopteris richardii]|nr:hypothetical protein KP509_1Z202700 [Ceratopteris richardii]
MDMCYKWKTERDGSPACGRLCPCVMSLERQQLLLLWQWIINPRTHVGEWWFIFHNNMCVCVFGMCMCMYKCMCVCMYVCFYVCMYVSMYMCVYVCMYVFIYMCAYACA